MENLVQHSFLLYLENIEINIKYVHELIPKYILFCSFASLHTDLLA
jgi:hypothetical protein